MFTTMRVSFGTEFGVVADELGREPVELLVEGRLHGLDGDAGADGRPAGADRGATDEPERHEGDVLGDPFLPDQPLVEA